MPEIQAAVSMPWQGQGAPVQAAASMPWQNAAPVQSLGGTYIAAGGGTGTPVQPNGLEAVYKLDPASAYVQAHTLDVVDLRTGLPLPVRAVTVSIQDGLAYWQVSGDGPDALFGVLTGGEQPAAIEVSIDGKAWRFLVETVTRPRNGLEATRVQFGGRSVAAAADAPYSFETSYVNDAPTTAAQLAAGALQAAGVDLEWRLEDWPIPAGAVSITGTPMAVVSAIANAVGAVVTADPSEMRVRVESRYPAMPNEWASTPPDVQIHSRAVRTETYQRADQPAYTGVVVSGRQGGALAYARLAGTSGAELAPLISDPLLTDAAALNERARAALAPGGRKATVTRQLPVRVGAGEPGVFSRGWLARCVDAPPAGAVSIWHGMVRSVSVAAALPEVVQTVTLERFDSFIVDPDLTAPVVLGAIPNQAPFVGSEFSLNLEPFRSGGKPPFEWSVRSGGLPNGINIEGEALAGTVSEASLATLSLRVTDASDRTLDTAAFSFTPRDSHWASVVLLLDMEAPNNSTAFVDKSASAHVMTVSGNARHTTAQTIYGTSSGFFDGAGDWVQTTTGISDFQFGTGDFTVECFFRTTDSKPQSLIDFYQTGNTGCWQLFLDAPAAFGFPTLGWWSSNLSAVRIVNGITDPRDGNWHHVEVSRVAGVTRLFIDGVLEGEAEDPRNYNAALPRMVVGAQVTTRNGAYDVNGNVKWVRITKGVGRHTANFTPPNGPMPTS